MALGMRSVCRGFRAFLWRDSIEWNDLQATEKDFLDCGSDSRKSRIEKMISSVRDSKRLMGRACFFCMAFFFLAGISLN